MASSAATASSTPLARSRFQARAFSDLSTLDALCWRLLIWVVGLVTPLMAMLKPRRFLVGEIGFMESTSGPSHLAMQLLFVFFVSFACLAFIRSLGKGGRKKEGGRLWLLTILLSAMPTVSSLISGGPFQISIVGIIALYSASYFLKVPPFHWWCREVRVMLLVLFVYGSLFSAVAAPQWAWNTEYGAESSMALFSLRLFGTTNHANALAPLAIFSFMLGRFPNCRLPAEFLHGLAAVAVLLLSQSKTNWGIALLLAGFYLFGEIRKLSVGKKLLILALIAGAALAVAGYLFMFCHLAARLDDLISDPQVFTLTGRLPLWMVAAQTWLDAPLLGQGLEAWSSDVLLDLVNLLGWAAPHAHNQILQVLSESGLVGLGVFLLWLVAFLKAARRAPERLRKPLWWLVAFFFLPGMTEVILQYNLGPGNSVLTWIMISTVMIAGSQQQKRPVRHAK